MYVYCVGQLHIFKTVMIFFALIYSFRSSEYMQFINISSFLCLNERNVKRNIYCCLAARVMQI